MSQTYESTTRMVTRPHPSLKAWWIRMNEYDRREIQKRIGYLPSLMELEAWPDLICTMIKFWDGKRMVFRFGDIELTPTLEEILASYESIGMCHERKSKPDRDILIPKVWGSEEIKKALSLVDIEWLKGPHIPFRELYYRFGRINGYERFKREFISEEAWEEKRPFVFAICLLGTMVFPQNLEHAIHPSVIMVTHAIFNGIKNRTSTKYYTLAPLILADIYRALDKCQIENRFFQGCNLILQWWMTKHLLKVHNPIEPDPRVRHDQFSSHSWWLYFNHFKVGEGQRFWMPILNRLREEDIQWSIEDVAVGDAIIRSKNLSFLVLAGLRGTRPYAPGRVLRQLGRKQDIPPEEDMGKFSTDHKDGLVSFAKMILRGWKTRSAAGEKAFNRFDAERSDRYKEWLQRTRTITNRNISSHVETKNRDDKIIEQLKEELNMTRQCIIELDDRIEQQIQSMEGISCAAEKTQRAKDYLWENRYFMWHEVETAKRAKITEENEAA